MDKSPIKNSCTDKEIILFRYQLSDQISLAFKSASNEMLDTEKNYYIEKPGSKKEKLEEENKAISLICAIAADLTNSASMLYASNNTYSASALVRQLVEVEYLAWAFEYNPAEARKWIKSDKQERLKFFTPAKLRKAAGNKFRSKDYGYHCELGGHPVPDSAILLNNKDNIGQLMLSDMIGHTWRIWDHLVKWAENAYTNHAIMRHALGLIDGYKDWKTRDVLTNLPPPWKLRGHNT